MGQLLELEAPDEVSDYRDLLCDQTRKRLDAWNALPRAEKFRLLKLRRYQTEPDLDVPAKIEEFWNKGQTINQIAAQMHGKGALLTFRQIRDILIQRGHTLQNVGERGGIVNVRKEI